jgi:hypothetical protein
MTQSKSIDYECTCDQLRHIRLKRLLIHGVIVECESCGGMVDRIEDGTVLDELVAELEQPKSELTVTLSRNAWVNGKQ